MLALSSKHWLTALLAWLWTCNHIIFNEVFHEHGKMSFCTLFQGHDEPTTWATTNVTGCYREVWIWLISSYSVSTWSNDLIQWETSWFFFFFLDLFVSVLQDDPDTASPSGLQFWTSSTWSLCLVRGYLNMIDLPVMKYEAKLTSNKHFSSTWSHY